MSEKPFRMSCQCDDHGDVLVQWDEPTRRCPLCAIRSAEKRTTRKLLRQRDQLRELGESVSALETKVASQKVAFDSKLREILTQVGSRGQAQDLDSEMSDFQRVFMDALNGVKS